MFLNALIGIASLHQPAPQPCPIIIVENISLLPFDSGSAELSAIGRQQLDMWLRIVRSRVHPTRFELIGQADRVGRRAANLRLSHRRVDAVRSYLRRGGVPDALIRSRAEGEDFGLVETADGVAEPSNRVVHLLAIAGPDEPTERRSCEGGAPGAR